MSYVLYTYQTVKPSRNDPSALRLANGALVCHAYTTIMGDPLDEALAQEHGHDLVQSQPGLEFMVLPAENLEGE